MFINMAHMGSDSDEDFTKSFNYKDENLTPIQKFFSHTNIFLTGGTGLLGLLVTEKLLFSCPNISKIYLLVRGKKGKDFESRLDELYDGVVFSRLRNAYPNFREKIVAIEGDCEFPEMGICAQDKQILMQEFCFSSIHTIYNSVEFSNVWVDIMSLECYQIIYRVNIVFHLAATVRFDEGIKKASFINVRAVRDITRLARKMPNLKCFLHVSTAFSNCIHKTIKEEVYPPVLDYKRLLDITESLPEDVLSQITPMLLGNYPNTYSFTKQIAEDVLKQEGRGLPIGIHRPAIVTPTKREPIIGWINSFYNSTGFSLAKGSGILRTTNADSNANFSIVPADMTVNSIIASAWDVAENVMKMDNETQQISVYNFADDKDSRITMGNYDRIATKYALLYPPTKMIWYPILVTFKNRWLFLIATFLLHFLPALIVDSARICLRKPPRVVKLYQKLDKFGSLLQFFSIKGWDFESANIRRLINRMSDKDREIFPSDLKNFDWDDYFKNGVIGCRLHLLKETEDTLPEARKKLRRLYWIHQLTKIIIGSLLLWTFWCLFTLLFRYLF